jgi:CheY-like chemotaxis protein
MDGRPDDRPDASGQMLDDVVEALDHLYDYLYLDHHRLARAVTAGIGEWNRGAALHRLLVEAIDRLKPPSGTPTHSPLWRRYRHALLRYVEGETVAQVAEGLGISERQARRDHQDAVRAIADLLLQAAPVGQGRPGRGAAQSAAGQPSAPPVDASLEREIARVGSAVGPGATQLSEIVHGVVRTVESLAALKGVRVEVTADVDATTIRGERAVVRQIVLGEVLWLVDLAARGAVVRARVQRLPEQVSLLLSLAHDLVGPGAAAADTERIAVARQLAELQGGALTVGRDDAELWVRLTLPHAPTPTVLLVDDNPSLLRLLRRYLSGSPFSVRDASSGAEALALAQAVRPSAVVLDVMMPSIDGWEVLQMLAAHPHTRHIPVIICSVLKERELALSLGAAAFLPKPVTQAALLQALASVSPAAAD